MKAIIIEDSRLARLELVSMLADFEQIQVIAKTGDPDEGIQLIKQHQPYVLFLDIQMPGKNGFEVLDAVNFSGQVIFTTAYDEYAIRSFEYDAFDYLLKPIEPQRLTASIEKLQKHHSDEHNSEQVTSTQLDAQSSVFLKGGEHCDFVPLKHIQQVDLAVNGNLLITLKQGQEIEASRRHSSRFKQIMSL